MSGLQLDRGGGLPPRRPVASRRFSSFRRPARVHTELATITERFLGEPSDQVSRQQFLVARMAPGMVRDLRFDVCRGRSTAPACRGPGHRLCGSDRDRGCGRYFPRGGFGPLGFGGMPGVPGSCGPLVEPLSLIAHLPRCPNIY
jgi:hypothetical protein